jgi:acetyl-CoA acyltransferase
LALRSQQVAHRATEEGRFEREIVPITVNGSQVVADQGIRPDTTIEAPAALRPAFKEDGRVTAGNASQISDGAAAVLLMTAEKARAACGRERASWTTSASASTRSRCSRAPSRRRGCCSSAMTSPSATWTCSRSTKRRPGRRGVLRETGADLDRVNVNGGAIALGHPLGSTGARLITTLPHELERSGGELGLVTMCCAGGLGTGTLIQRI